MSGPLRFKHDPNFLKETGCDLNAQPDLMAQYDLPGLREKVMADVASGGAASAAVALQTKALVGLFAVLVGGAGFLGYMSIEGPADPATEAAISFATEEPVAEPVVEPVEVTPEVEAAVAFAVGEPTRQAVVSEPVVAQPEPITAQVVEEPAVVDDVAAESNDGIADADAGPKTGTGLRNPGDLAGQNDVYQSVNMHMDAKDYQRARSTIGLYLKLYPDGDHLHDMLVTMTECMYRQESWGEAEKMAERVVAIAELPQHQRQQIAKLRAESLVMLDRCEEAAEAALLADRKVATAVKQQCRKRAQ